MTNADKASLVSMTPQQLVDRYNRCGIELGLLIGRPLNVAAYRGGLFHIGPLDGRTWPQRLRQMVAASASRRSGASRRPARPQRR